MKKIAIVLALVMLAQVSVCAAATNYNKKSVQKTQNVSAKKQTSAKQPARSDEYLLKYNINDLEAAPWLNGGKRKI